MAGAAVPVVVPFQRCESTASDRDELQLTATTLGLHATAVTWLGAVIPYSDADCGRARLSIGSVSQPSDRGSNPRSATNLQLRLPHCSTYCSTIRDSRGLGS